MNIVWVILGLAVLGAVAWPIGVLWDRYVTQSKYGIPIVATAIVGALAWMPVYALIMSAFDVHASNAFHWAIMGAGTVLTAFCLGLYKSLFAGMVRDHQNHLKNHRA